MALSALVVTGSAVGGFVAPASAADIGGASTEAGPAARPPPDAPSSYGPDCRQHPNAVARADETDGWNARASPGTRPRAPPTEPDLVGEPLRRCQLAVPVPQPAVRVGSVRGVADHPLPTAPTAIEACSWFAIGCATILLAGGRSPFSWNDHSTAIRTWVLACAAVVAPRAAWVREALRVHGNVLADPDFYVNHGNHALNQSRGLLAAGCILGRRDWQRLAARRIAALIVESVDRQGVTNEQSVYYQVYNLQAYRAAAERLRACGVDVPRSFRRLNSTPDLLTHATLPDGTYVTLGNTSHNKAIPIPGTTAAYAASKGPGRSAAGAAIRRLRCRLRVRAYRVGDCPTHRSGGPVFGTFRTSAELSRPSRPWRRNAVRLREQTRRRSRPVQCELHAMAQVRDQPRGARGHPRGRRRVRRLIDGDDRRRPDDAHT